MLKYLNNAKLLIKKRLSCAIDSTNHQKY